MRYKKYPACSRCDAEISPGVYDDCEKYYVVDREIMCKDCFRDWVRDRVETSLDDVAAALDVPVVEVI